MLVWCVLHLMTKLLNIRKCFLYKSINSKPQKMSSKCRTARVLVQLCKQKLNYQKVHELVQSGSIRDHLLVLLILIFFYIY